MDNELEDLSSPEPLLNNEVHPHDSVFHDQCPQHPYGASYHTGYAIQVSFPAFERVRIVPMSVMKCLVEGCETEFVQWFG